MKPFPKKTGRWLKTIEIAQVLFEEEGYHLVYLEEISAFIRRKKMYSPKIREDLIPALYKMARAKRVPMTTLVNDVLEEYLEKNANPKGRRAKKL